MRNGLGLNVAEGESDFYSGYDFWTLRTRTAALLSLTARCSLQPLPLTRMRISAWVAETEHPYSVAQPISDHERIRCACQLVDMMIEHLERGGAARSVRQLSFLSHLFAVCATGWRQVGSLLRDSRSFSSFGELCELAMHRRSRDLHSPEDCSKALWRPHFYLKR